MTDLKTFEFEPFELELSRQDIDFHKHSLSSFQINLDLYDEKQLLQEKPVEID